MAPVFSRPAWCCVWHMIQNDLIRMGWICSLAIVHRTIKLKMLVLWMPSTSSIMVTLHWKAQMKMRNHHQNLVEKTSVDVRRESYNEMKVFKRKWELSRMINVGLIHTM